MQERLFTGVGETPNSKKKREIILLLVLTFIAGVFHFSLQSTREIWFDEACTYLWTRNGFTGLLSVLQKEAHPPIYPTLMTLTVQLFGPEVLTLRLPSILFATALVPAIYYATRAFSSGRVALLAATLGAASPLVHYYSVEARSYTLLLLLVTTNLYTFHKALKNQKKKRTWIYFGLTLLFMLYTHNYSVFLVPVFLFVALCYGKGIRSTLFMRTLCATLAASLLYLPFLIQVLSMANIGAANWIIPWWKIIPPALAIPRSLEVFGFGGEYPKYLSYLGQAPSIRSLSLMTTISLLALAASPARRPPPATQYKLFLFSFLFGPLLISFVYSLILKPIYVVGRYDMLGLPAFLILLAIGIDKMYQISRKLGIAITITLFVLAGTTLSTTLFNEHSHSKSREHLISIYLELYASKSDPLISMGFSRPLLEYHINRKEKRRAITSFPSELEKYPGHFNPLLLMQNKQKIEREGDHLALELSNSLPQDGHIWIVISKYDEMDKTLLNSLQPFFEQDQTLSQKGLSLLSLKKK